jgi:hypothetical protein
VLLRLDRSGFFEKWEAARSPENADESGVTGRGEEERTGEHLPEWKSGLEQIREYRSAEDQSGRESWPPQRQVLYVFDIPRTLSGGRATVHLYFRDEEGKTRPLPGSGIRLEDLWQIPAPEDREILGVLRGGSFRNVYDPRGYHLLGQEIQLLCPTYLLDVDLVRLLLPKMAQSGRLFLKTREDFDARGSSWEHPIGWDVGSPWVFGLSLGPSSGGGKVRLEGVLNREGERIPLAKPELLLAGGLMFLGGDLVRYTMNVSFAWISVLRGRKHLTVPRAELPGFLEELLSFSNLDPLEIDETLGIRAISGAPLPGLRVNKADRVRHSATGGGLIGELSFHYGEQVLSAPAQNSGTYV